MALTLRVHDIVKRLISRRPAMTYLGLGIPSSIHDGHPGLGNQLRDGSKSDRFTHFLGR